MAYFSFEDLEVWRLGCDLAVEVYESLDGCRDFGLRSQMTRAAVSVSSNIAEGAERGSARDFMRFLHISKGSLAELRTQLLIANRIGVLSERQTSDLSTKCRRISGMLHALIKQQSTKVSDAADGEVSAPFLTPNT